MKKLLFALVALALSQSSYAADPGTVDFSKIELKGTHLIDSDQQDAFPYKMRVVAAPDAQVVKTLEEESFSTIVSPLYELDETSSFKNIYYYIGKTEEGTFELVMAYVNSSGNIFIVDMDIKNVEKDHLDIIHGTYEPNPYTLVSEAGDLFPNGGF